MRDKCGDDRRKEYAFGSDRMVPWPAKELPPDSGPSEESLRVLPGNHR